MSEQQDTPAVVVNPTTESRTELLQVVRSALNDAPITLADDALTRESVLIIQRMTQRDLQDRPLSGRDLGRPARFRLVMRGSHCLLEREASGERWMLTQATCVEEVQ